jgi:hypothetical protein
MSIWADDHGGIPLDADYFDVHGVAEVASGETKILTSFIVPEQYNGILIHFKQYFERRSDDTRRPKSAISTFPIFWTVQAAGQPFDQYANFATLLNPWSADGLPLAIRLEEGKQLEVLVRNAETDTKQVPIICAARLIGRFWYNRAYGGLG